MRTPLPRSRSSSTSSSLIVCFLCRSHAADRSEEHTSELQSQSNLVCRLLLEKKKTDLYKMIKMRSGKERKRVRMAFKPPETLAVADQCDLAGLVHACSLLARPPHVDATAVRH